MKPSKLYPFQLPVTNPSKTSPKRPLPKKTPLVIDEDETWSLSAAAVAEGCTKPASKGPSLVTEENKNVNLIFTQLIFLKNRN